MRMASMLRSFQAWFAEKRVREYARLIAVCANSLVDDPGGDKAMNVDRAIALLLTVRKLVRPSASKPRCAISLSRARWWPQMATLHARLRLEEAVDLYGKAATGLAERPDILWRCRANGAKACRDLARLGRNRFVI